VVNAEKNREMGNRERESVVRKRRVTIIAAIFSTLCRIATIVILACVTSKRVPIWTRNQVVRINRRHKSVCYPGRFSRAGTNHAVPKPDGTVCDRCFKFRGAPIH